jgi:hypothetical protein
VGCDAVVASLQVSSIEISWGVAKRTANGRITKVEKSLFSVAVQS